MKANAESSTRVHLVRAKTGVVEELSVEELEAKVKELEEMWLAVEFSFRSSFSSMS